MMPYATYLMNEHSKSGRGSYGSLNKWTDVHGVEEFVPRS